MNNDLDIIVKKFPMDFEALHVYAIGDVHVGSEEYDEKSVLKKIDIIKNDPYGVVCICGDLGDFGLRNSKTNVYRATMQPKEQKDYIYELFKPIAEKITAAVPGNHEERLMKEVGTCPLYDLCVLWGIPDVYRENLAITKYIFGKGKGKNTQHNFVGITTHGSTRSRHKKFIECFDGIDFAISGHTHTPEYSPHGKLRVDRNKLVVTHAPYKELVVDANLKVGGYGLKKEYEIPTTPELQYLELIGYRETDGTRRLRRTINYHTITI